MESITAQQWRELITTPPADPLCCRFCARRCPTNPKRIQHELLHVRGFQCTEGTCFSEWSTRQRGQRHNPHHQLEEVCHAPRRLLRGNSLLPGWQLVQPVLRIQRVTLPETQAIPLRTPSKTIPPPEAPDQLTLSPQEAYDLDLIYDLPELNLEQAVANLLTDELPPPAENLTPLTPPVPENSNLFRDLPELDLDASVANLLQGEPLETNPLPPLELDACNPTLALMWNNPLPIDTPAITVDEALRQHHLQMEADLQHIQRLARQVQQHQEAILDLQETQQPL